MTNTEIILPFTKDDFESGDRVFYLSYGYLSKGTIFDSRFPDPEHLKVTIDGGGQISVHLSCFVRGAGFDYWGKIPDLSQIREGTVLSRLEDDGSRKQLKVTSYIPGNSIKMHSVSSPSAVYDYQVASGIVLEDKLLEWEIEE